MYARLAVCMWASVSVRRAALCAASVSSWGGTVRNARVLHVACRFAKTARLRATSFAWGLRRPAICGGPSWSRRRLPWAAPLKAGATALDVRSSGAATSCYWSPPSRQCSVRDASKRLSKVHGVACEKKTLSTEDKKRVAKKYQW